MAKSSKKNRMKLPKRLLGVKLPKDARKRLNKMLKSASSDDANPLIAAAVGSVVTLLAERLEQPLEALLSPAPKRDRRAVPASEVQH